VIGDANPAKDRVAFASAATTGFGRDLGDVTPGSLALDACMAAIRDAGIPREEINGLVGANPQFIQSALGIPHLTYWNGPGIPFVAAIANAMNAIATGAADVVLAYHSLYRSPMFSRAAARDPFRASTFGLGGMPAGMADDGFGPDSVAGAVGYTAWASRYLHEYGSGRETFGYIAVNDRSNAARNPAAVLREPITMDDYLGARMIRSPLCLLDMDVPVDGADAFVLTTAERARDLALPPVLIHACTQGMIAQNEEDQTPSLRDHGQHVVVQSLRAKSDLWLDDVDVYFPYDGFSFITVSWIENTGWCGLGEARAFIEDQWDHDGSRILIDGRIPVNPHGGGLSEGGTQGSGHTREAIHQLQGRAGERQVPDARTALLTAGGFFFNAQGCVLRTDDG
jgi:acetyl-CoA acetyltransferase